jgi:hypothetical protein
MVGLAVVLPAPARAQEPSPSPKELWEAYPLQPGQAPPAATPVASVSASPAPRRAPRDGDGVPWLAAVLLAAPLVVAGGLLVGHRRSRTRAEPTVAGPAEPKRFQWRDYPPPARPAAPPPPVPGGPSFEAALERERAGAPSRAAQREPH